MGIRKLSVPIAAMCLLGSGSSAGQRMVDLRWGRRQTWPVAKAKDFTLHHGINIRVSHR